VVTGNELARLIFLFRVGLNVAETLLCDVEVHRKTRAASCLLGFLRPRVLRSHTTAAIVKKTVCESMVLGMLLHGSECWMLTSKLTHLLENFHHRAVRTMNAVSLFIPHPQALPFNNDTFAPDWPMHHAGLSRQTHSRMGGPRSPHDASPMATQNANVLPATPPPTRSTPENLWPLLNSCPRPQMHSRPLVAHHGLRSNLMAPCHQLASCYTQHSAPR
jgi:hypothetical protein